MPSKSQVNERKIMMSLSAMRAEVRDNGGLVNVT